MTRKPNLFILGAPKSGTKSLAYWLAEHPQAFLAPGKEPHHFNIDHIRPARHGRDAYLQLFRAAAPDCRALIDASVWYLASEAAVPAILDFNPESKFIVCLRNPRQMVYSLHQQQIYNGIERLTKFADAWMAQADRLEGVGVPAGAEPFHLQYGPACLIGTQLERATRLIPSERLHIVFLEDMKNDPRQVYDNVLRFAGLDNWAARLEPLNASKTRRSLWIKRLTRQIGRMKWQLGFRRSFGLLKKVDSWNFKTEQWQANPGLESEIREYFREDIAKLAAVTGRNLAHWLD